MSRHALDRGGIALDHLAVTLGAASAEPVQHGPDDDVSIAYVCFLDDSGQEVDLDDAVVQQAIEDYTPPPAPDPDGDLAASISAVDTSKITDTATRAALNALKAALLGSGKPAAASGRPTSR